MHSTLTFLLKALRISFNICAKLKKKQELFKAVIKKCVQRKQYIFSLLYYFNFMYFEKENVKK